MKQSKTGRPHTTEADRLRCYSIRLTSAQIDKLVRLGGGCWVRQQLNRQELGPDTAVDALLALAGIGGT